MICRPLCAPTAAHHLFSNYYTGPGKFLDRADYFADIFERACMLGSHTSSLSAEISSLTGDTTSYEKSTIATDRFEEGRNMVGMMRAVLAWGCFVTIFLEQDKETHALKLVNKKDGSTVQLNKAGTHALKEDGTPVNLEETEYVLKGWKSIAMGLGSLFARTLSFVRHLGRMGAYDLGKHAQTLGYTVFSLWAAVLALEWISSLDKLLNSDVPEDIKKAFIHFVAICLDLLALLFDFRLIPRAHPAVAIIGCIVCMSSAVVYPLKEFLYY